MNDDLISRKMAIDAIIDHIREKFAQRDTPLNYISGLYKAEDIIEILPSAEPEIVRCEDCKNWYAFSDKKFGYCRRECWDDDAQYRLKVETMYDDYCSYAERRIDG